MKGTKCWCGSVTTPPTPAPGSDGTWVCAASPLHAPYATGRKERIQTLYVAGPMSGYEEANYPAFNEAADLLRSVGFTVLNPVDVHEPVQCHYVDLLREDLIMMFQADGVAVLENWWESTGARNEVQVAGLLKMPVRPVTDWLSRAAYELHKEA